MLIKQNEDLLKLYGIKTTTETKKIPLGEKINTFDVYEIPIEKLKYNLKNGRIFMELAELLKQSDVNLKELMESDQERYNEEIEKLVWDSNTEKNEATKKDIEKYNQIEPGVILPDGTVIDGNRRFTCLRKLYNDMNNKDREKFKYFKAAILWNNNEITEKVIKELELKVQFGQDQKVGYKSINFNMSIYDSISKDLFSIKEVASAVNKSPAAITKIKETGDLLYKMLDYVGVKENLLIAQKLSLYWPLEPFNTYLKSINPSKIQKERIEHLFFDHIIGLDVTLPTQEFRDNLIGKILKDPRFSDDYINNYEKYHKSSIKKEIINNKDGELIDRIKEFRISDDSGKILDDYKKFVKKADGTSLMEEPKRIIEEINKLLEELDKNIQMFLEVDEANAKQILEEVKNSLVETTKSISSLVKKI
jgi:hypothetical protein